MRVDWAFIAKLKRKLKVPLIVKGIATAEDAALALENGVDVVYVSNHGGRQLDQRPRGDRHTSRGHEHGFAARPRSSSTAVSCAATDILKSLAMGADLVGLGRLQALALGAAGREGVVRMLELLETEITVGMKLLGATKLDELDGNSPPPGGSGRPSRPVRCIPAARLARETRLAAGLSRPCHGCMIPGYSRRAQRRPHLGENNMNRFVTLSLCSLPIGLLATTAFAQGPAPAAAPAGRTFRKSRSSRTRWAGNVLLPRGAGRQRRRARSATTAC
jgi:hypothetical protein